MTRRWAVAVLLAILAVAGTLCALSESRTAVEPSPQTSHGAAEREVQRARAAPSESAAGTTASAPEVEEAAPRRATHETGTVRGVVRDRQGRPVADASVWFVPANAQALLQDLDGTADGGIRALRTRSGADGAYAAEVPLGMMHYALATAEPRAGSAAIAQFGLNEEQPSITLDLRLRVAGALDVVVTDADGRPVGAADVIVRMDSWQVVLPTGADGCVAVDGLDVGKHTVYVRAPGLPMAEHRADVEEGMRTRVEVALLRGHALEGVVVDDAGSVVAGAQILAWPKGRSGGWEASARTDARGLFRIAGLLEGPHDLRIVSWRYTARMPDVRAPGTGVRFVLTRRATLRFAVTAPEDPDPADLLVRCAGDEWARSWRTGTGTGMFEVPELAPGTQTVLIRVPEFAPFERVVELRPGEVTDIGEIQFDPGHALRGRVVDASGRPIAGASLRAGAMMFDEKATTGADGAFRLDHVARGDTTVEVKADGFLDRSVVLRAGPGEAAEDVVLARGGVLRGTVRSRDGSVVSGASVHVFDAAAEARGDDMDEREERTSTDARGAFSARLLAGRYRVEVEAKSGDRMIRADAEVELSASAEPFVVELPE